MLPELGVRPSGTAYSGPSGRVGADTLPAAISGLSQSGLMNSAFFRDGVAAAECPLLPAGTLSECLF